MKIKISQVLLNVILMSCFISGAVYPLGILGDINIRLSQLVILTSYILMLVIISFGILKDVNFKYSWFDVIILFYCLVNFYSNIFSYGLTEVTVKVLLNTMSFYFMFSITYNIIFIVDLSVYDIVNKYISYGFLFSIFGLFGLLLSVLSHKKITFGVSFNHFDNYYGSIKSFAFEPNLFAIICLTIITYYLLYMMYYDLSIIHKLFILSVSLIFSYTRSAYISLVFIFIYLLLFVKNKNKSDLRFRKSILALIIIFISFLVGVNSNVTERVTDLSKYEIGSSRGRLLAFSIGLIGFTNSPFIGNGTMSADTRIYKPEYGGYTNPLGGSNGWLFSAFIQSLHDTGILGFINMIILLFYPLKKWYDHLKKAIKKRDVMLSYFFIISNAIIVFTTQISSILWISFPWLFWGLSIGILDRINDSRNTIILSNNVKNKYKDKY